MSRLALLCPGQGGQHPGMFDFLGAADRTASLLEQWRLEDRLGRRLDAVLADPFAFYSNRMAQPLIVAATVAAWTAVKDIVPAPALIAGYSVGEIASYAVAGSVSAQDAIAVAVARAELMGRCLQASARQSLMSVSGLGIAQVEALLSGDTFVAIETGEDSVIVGGLSESLLALQKRIQGLRGRTTMLPVEVASHTPLMSAAVAPFVGELQKHAFPNPAVPVMAGISADLIRRREHAIDTLSRQLNEKIRWMDCMDACVEAGVAVALELGPGSALSRMFQARHPGVACRSIADFRSLAGLAAWLARHVGE